MANAIALLGLQFISRVNRIDRMDNQDIPTRDALFAQIRAELALRGMTQAQLAERIGMDAAVLSRYMTARREMSINIYLKISRELGLPPDHLMSKAAEKAKK